MTLRLLRAALISTQFGSTGFRSTAWPATCTLRRQRWCKIQATRQCRKWSCSPRRWATRRLAAQQLRPIVREGMTIISFQNGVDGPEMIQRELRGAHVVPGVARIGSRIARPGVIEHMSPFARIEFGEASGGNSDKLERFRSICEAASIDAVLSNDIVRNVWMKFAMLASFSGMAALTGHTSGPLRTNPRTRAMIETAIREVIAVGQAVGGWLTPEGLSMLMKAIDSQPIDMTSSMAHDRKTGKPLEVDYLSGTVVRIGSMYGVATPTHQFIADALAIDTKGAVSREPAAGTKPARSATQQFSPLPEVLRHVEQPGVVRGTGVSWQVGLRRDRGFSR